MLNKMNIFKEFFLFIIDIVCLYFKMKLSLVLMEKKIIEGCRLLYISLVLKDIYMLFK